MTSWEDYVITFSATAFTFVVWRKMIDSTVRFIAPHTSFRMTCNKAYLACQQVARVGVREVPILSTCIPSVDKVHNLGAVLDSHLTFSEQVALSVIQHSASYDNYVLSLGFSLSTPPRLWSKHSSPLTWITATPCYAASPTSSSGACKLFRTQQRVLSLALGDLTISRRFFVNFTDSQCEGASVSSWRRRFIGPCTIFLLHT